MHMHTCIYGRRGVLLLLFLLFLLFLLLKFIPAT
jgi:hypothetical protein